MSTEYKYEDLQQIETKIVQLTKNIDSEPLTVKKEIDNILKCNSELIEWYTTKIELLKTKAIALINLWDIEEADKSRKTYRR